MQMQFLSGFISNMFYFIRFVLINAVKLFSGTLHVGDEIREINDVKVANQTIDTLQSMLVSCLKQMAFVLMITHLHE